MIGLLRVFGLCGILLLTACGGGSDVEGTYFMQMGEGPGEGVTLELKDEGVAVVSIPGMHSTQGTFTQEGDKLTVILAGDSDVYSIGDDGNLTTNEMGETLVMVKQ